MERYTCAGGAALILAACLSTVVSEAAPRAIDSRSKKHSIQAPAPDGDLKLSKQSAAAAAPAPSGISQPQAAAKVTPAPKAKPTVRLKAIELTEKGADPEAAWSSYFSKHQDVEPAAIRASARQLMNDQNYADATAMIRAALRTGQPQSWMYEALALAMQLGGSSKTDIERALMSAVDFSDNPDDLMYVAQYMARSGLESRALKIFRQVATQQPLRPEPYLYGLQLAQRLNNTDAIKWSSLGVLRQAWPNKERAVQDTALHAAGALLDQLKGAKKLKEAAAFESELKTALERDCLVKVTWNGDADVDLLVEEPSGTVCSFRNPRTVAGGVMLGDSAARASNAATRSVSEVYVCPQAFSGNYRMLLRRVWGKVAAGKVTVDVYTHFGAKQQQHRRRQIPIGDSDAMVLFDVPEGRRKEPLAQQQVANAAVGQVQLNQAILSQQLGGLSSQGAASKLGLSRAGLAGAFNGPLVRGAVGYQPVIISLPAGANMTATGVISADRRYVRITALPLFSQIGQVTTFNIASGSQSTQGAPPAGGGGLPGNGIGGGVGGGGGGGF